MEILARQTYNDFGKSVNSKTNYSSNGLMSHEMVAKLTDQSYRKMNKFPSHENNYKITFGPFVAITETVAALALVWCFRSIATVLNLLMTFGEFGQAWVAGMDPNERTANQSVNGSKQTANIKNAIEDKESGMAWFQILAGTGGVMGLAYEFLFGKKTQEPAEDVPLLKKITLSATSALNVFFMLSGAAEKSMMSMFSWNGGGKEGKGQGQDYRSMQINGAADVRGAIEWAFMTVVPWVSQVESLKHLVDVAVTYGALREGADYFNDSGKVKLSFGGKNLLNVKLSEKPFLKSLIQGFVNPVSLFTKSKQSDEKQYNLCWPFNSIRRWYLGSDSDKGYPGSSGLRNKFVAPILRSVFNCELPNVFLNDDNIVCEYVNGVDYVLNSFVQNPAKVVHADSTDLNLESQKIRKKPEQTKFIEPAIAL